MKQIGQCSTFKGTGFYCIDPDIPTFFELDQIMQFNKYKIFYNKDFTFLKFYIC